MTAATPRTVPARTQSERRAATTGALLDAARVRFASEGFAETSLDAVVADAGVTKGALYHHFASKRDLFKAVFDREQARLAQALADAFVAERDPWDGLKAACRAFLDTALEPDIQRIVLVDSFSVLGLAAVREAEAGLLDGLVEALRLSIDAGRIAPRPPEPLAALIFGALCEGALTTARSRNTQATHAAVVEELERAFTALAGAPKR